MHSEEEIIKNFELLGLFSPEARERLERLGNFRLGAEPSDSYVFIKNDSKSDMESEDAKLETDS